MRRGKGEGRERERKRVGRVGLKPSQSQISVYVTECRTFHTQVVLVYLEWFRRNSLLKCTYIAA